MAGRALGTTEGQIKLKVSQLYSLPQILRVSTRQEILKSSNGIILPNLYIAFEKIPSATVPPQNLVSIGSVQTDSLDIRQVFFLAPSPALQFLERRGTFLL